MSCEGLPAEPAAATLASIENNGTLCEHCATIDFGRMLKGDLNKCVFFTVDPATQSTCRLCRFFAAAIQELTNTPQTCYLLSWEEFEARRGSGEDEDEEIRPGRTVTLALKFRDEHTREKGVEIIPVGANHGIGEAVTGRLLEETVNWELMKKWCVFLCRLNLFEQRG